MAEYATYELAQAMIALSPAQRAAIDRIVQHVYIENRPISHLLQGDDKICTEVNYYKRGILDPETGEWRRQGWHHQPAFQEALQMAARLALQTQETEELHALRTAVRRARLASAPVVDELERIARRGLQERDRISAAGKVLDIALRHTEFAEGESNQEEDDWWWAADDGDE